MAIATDQESLEKVRKRIATRSTTAAATAATIASTLKQREQLQSGKHQTSGTKAVPALQAQRSLKQGATQGAKHSAAVPARSTTVPNAQAIRLNRHYDTVSASKQGSSNVMHMPQEQSRKTPRVQQNKIGQAQDTSSIRPRFWNYEQHRLIEEEPVQIVYCRTKEESEAAATILINEEELGIDFKWVADTTRTGIRASTSALLLASKRMIAIFHLTLHTEDDSNILAASLKAILESRDILKCGVGVLEANRRQLAQTLKVVPRRLFELSRLFRLTADIVPFHQKGSKKLVALTEQVEHYFNLPIDNRESVEAHDWAQPLRVPQQKCVANDAYAALCLFYTMDRIRKSVPNPMPRPVTVSASADTTFQLTGVEWEEDSSEASLGQLSPTPQPPEANDSPTNTVVHMPQLLGSGKSTTNTVPHLPQPRVLHDKTANTLLYGGAAHYTAPQSHSSTESEQYREEALPPQAQTLQHRPYIAPALTTVQMQNLPSPFKGLINKRGYLSKRKVYAKVLGKVPCFFECGQQFDSYAHAAIHLIEPEDIGEDVAALGFKVHEVRSLSRRRQLHGLPSIGRCGGALNPGDKSRCPFRRALGDHVVCPSSLADLEPIRPKPYGQFVANRALAADIAFDHVSHQCLHTEQTDWAAGLPCQCGMLWSAPQFAALHFFTSYWGPSCQGVSQTAEQFIQTLDAIYSRPILKHMSPLVGELFYPNKRQPTEPVKRDCAMASRLTWTAEDGKEDAFSKLLDSVPTVGHLVIFPFRHFGIVKQSILSRAAEAFRRHRVDIVRDHQNIFRRPAPVLCVELECASVLTPVFAGGQYWAQSPQFRLLQHGVCKLDEEHLSGVRALYRSAIVTDLVFRLFESRSPKDRVLLCVADSWTSCIPLLAHACTLHDFRLHIGLTQEEVQIADKASQAGKSLKRALESGDSRCRGIRHGRHWFEIDSTTLAKVYAGAISDSLTEGYLRWCTSCRNSEVVLDETSLERQMEMQLTAVEKEVKRLAAADIRPVTPIVRQPTQESREPTQSKLVCRQPHTALPLTMQQINNLPRAMQPLIATDGYLDAYAIQADVPGGIACQFECGERFSNWAKAAIHVIPKQLTEKRAVSRQLTYEYGKGARSGLVNTGICIRYPSDRVLRQCPYQYALGNHITCNSIIAEGLSGYDNEGRVQVLIKVFWKNLRADLIHHQGRPNLPTDMPTGLPCRCGILWPTPQLAAVHLLTDLFGPRCTGKDSSLSMLYKSLGCREGFQLDAGDLKIHVPAKQRGHNIAHLLKSGQNSTGILETGKHFRSRVFQSIDELVEAAPPSGVLVILPFSKGADAHQTKLRQQRNERCMERIRQHNRAFASYSPAVELQFVSSNTFHPILVGTREWALTHGAWHGDVESFTATSKSGKVGISHAAALYRSALASDAIFRLFATRQPHERILLASENTWSFCTPLLAWASATYDFRLRMSFTYKQMEAVNEDDRYGPTSSNHKQGESIPRFLDTLNASRPRYRGTFDNRYWFELHSTTIARVFAGLESDMLTEGFLRWCRRTDNKFQAAAVASAQGRKGKAPGENPVRRRMLDAFVGMEERVRELLESKDKAATA